MLGRGRFLGEGGEGDSWEREEKTIPGKGRRGRCQGEGEEEDAWEREDREKPKKRRLVKTLY